MTSGIYLVTNKVNGRMYIGQSLNIQKRWGEHSRTPKGECQYFYNAIRKYGWDSFDKRVLICVDNKEDMNIYERQLIESYGTLSPNGYNCKDGGLSGTVCEETRMKQSAAKKGKPQNLTDEQREARAQVWRGRRHSEETKQKMREWNLGRKMPPDCKTFSPEYRQRMSEMKKGIKPAITGVGHTEEAKQKMKDAWARRKAAQLITDGGQL